jgi:division protein CdvB (Snf7/Vps24/ESCRT-III family)
MNEDMIQRLGTISSQLHMRSLELSHPGQDNDLASVMQALAVTMEAVSAIGQILNQQNGPQGLGAAGSD